MEYSTASPWFEKNQEPFNKALDSLRHIRRFVDSYQSVFIAGPDALDSTMAFIANKLITKRSRKVFWSSAAGCLASFREIFEEDCLESLIHDQTNVNTLVIFLCPSQKNPEIERALQYCAENFIPSLVVSATASGEPGPVSNFSFPSKVYDLVLKTDSRQTFEWLLQLIFSQAVTDKTDSFYLNE